MKFLLIFAFLFSTIIIKGQETMKFKQLTPEEQQVILYKGTERPFTGKYDKFYEKGTYVCKQCGAALFHSESKFDSGSGWPGFDDEIKGAVKRIPDADGCRTEIVCANCGGHLGHVFTGEQFTLKNTRYCVNSISLDFIPDVKSVKTDRAILASGCFWGVEFHLKREKGVIETTAGYTGGHVVNPTYEQVCTGKTGHAEAVEVIFDSGETSYETLLKVYFETHDFTQIGGQGPDIGDQYRSVIFYLNDEQKSTAEKLIRMLQEKGYKVATKLEKATDFYPAENYHQDYYDKTGGNPYCHIRKKVF